MAGVRQAAGDRICTTGAADLVRRPFASLLRCRLSVPALQRRYCWQGAQLRRLVDDVVTQCGGGSDGGVGDGGHSFGRVVVRATAALPARLVIIDGQQRLTSVALLVASLRDVVRRRLWQEQQREEPEEEEQAAARELVDSCNGWLFPWGNGGASLPPLESLAGEGAEPGQVCGAAALLPTFLDRDAFWEATHPDSDLRREREDPGTRDPAPTGAGVHLLEGPDRVRAAKATLVDYLEASALPAAIHKLGLLAVPGGGGGLKPAARHSLGNVASAAGALLDSVLHGCHVLYFPVREEDVWSVYERLAFREAGLALMMDNKAPGVSMAECDLVRNLLLSYLGEEEDQLGAYFAFWRPMEARAQEAAKAAAQPHSRRPPQAALKRPLEADASTSAMLGRLMERYLQARGEQPREPQAAAATSYTGGAMHLAAGPFFPTYRRFREAVEAAIQRQGGAQPGGSAQDVAGAVAEGVLAELLELSRDPASFQQLPAAAAAQALGRRQTRPKASGMPVIRDGPEERLGGSSSSSMMMSC